MSAPGCRVSVASLTGPFISGDHPLDISRRGRVRLYLPRAVSKKGVLIYEHHVRSLGVVVRWVVRPREDGRPAMSKAGVTFQVGTHEMISPTVRVAVMGEVLGTFLLSFIGLGIGCTAFLWSTPDGAYFADILPTVVTWGMVIGVATYVSGSLSGAHFNPAVTLAFAATGRHPWNRVPLYIGCQLLGWIIGSLGLVALFGPAMQIKAAQMGIDFHSERIGSLLVSYAPNPGFAGSAGFEAHTFWVGFGVEVICTAVMMLAILATGASLVNRPPAWAGALIIGFTVGLLLMFAAPLSQASFNPARDLGPRIVLALMGFGDHAFPGTGVYAWSVISTTIGPIIGAVSSAAIFDAFDKKIRRTVYGATKTS